MPPKSRERKKERKNEESTEGEISSSMEEGESKSRSARIKLQRTIRAGEAGDNLRAKLSSWDDNE